MKKAQMIAYGIAALLACQVFPVAASTAAAAADPTSTNEKVMDQSGAVTLKPVNAAVEVADVDAREPVTKELTAEEQAALSKIYGAAPATSKTLALIGGTTVYYYDKDGKLVGTSHQTTGTQEEQPVYYYDKDHKVIQIGDQKLVPPARPGDDVADPAAWQKYYKDYVNYVTGLADVRLRSAAWETLAKDIFKQSQEHPEYITAGAIDSVMNALANELKEKYRNDAYEVDVGAAQKYVVDAALNLVKSDAFKTMTDAEQAAVGHYFMVLGV
ncbi:MAG: hypothetical protein PHT59_08035, partial [Candidatus Omnitrophica bacterium]|nr:hypothetical protein [Candidatus Omnitrophota bacterium]